MPRKRLQLKPQLGLVPEVLPLKPGTELAEIHTKIAVHSASCEPKQQARFVVNVLANENNGNFVPFREAIIPQRIVC